MSNLINWDLAGPPIIVYVDDGTDERCLLCVSTLIIIFII